jgi:basic amino acid/polyamine antiporter, APA family
MSIKPKLSTFDATMIVVSLVIGIGIFRTPAIVASATGTAWIFFAAWILGGIFSYFGALTFAEIGSRVPRPGAYYTVVAECYHPSVAFMLNWINVIIVNTAGSAAVAMIGAEYLMPIVFPAHMQTPLTLQLIAAGMTFVLLGINFAGIKSGAWTQNVLTVVKIGMMALIIIVAFISGSAAESASASPTTTTQPLYLALGLGLIAVYYTYGGYQNTLNFGADVKSPERNIPRAIFFGISIIIGLYLLINGAYYYVLGIKGMAGAKLVAAEVARVCFGQSASTIVSVVIVLSAMGFVNVTLMQIPRTYYAMAESGTLPKIFMKVNEKTQAQEFTLLFFGGMIMLSIFLLGTFESLVNYIMFFDNINNAIVASTIFVLRKRMTSSPVAYKVRFYPVLPALFVLFLLGISLNVLLSKPTDTYIGLAILAIGFPIYYIMRRVSR